MISGRISRRWSSVCHIANRIGTEAYPSGIKMAIFRGNETHGFEGKKLTVIITLKINCGSTKLTIVEIIIDRAVMKDTKFAFYTFSRQERFLFG